MACGAQPANPGLRRRTDSVRARGAYREGGRCRPHAVRAAHATESTGDEVSAQRSLMELLRLGYGGFPVTRVCGPGLQQRSSRRGGPRVAGTRGAGRRARTPRLPGAQCGRCAVLLPWPRPPRPPAPPGPGRAWPPRPRSRPAPGDLGSRAPHLTLRQPAAPRGARAARARAPDPRRSSGADVAGTGQSLGAPGGRGGPGGAGAGRGAPPGCGAAGLRRHHGQLRRDWGGARLRGARALGKQSGAGGRGAEAPGPRGSS